MAEKVDRGRMGQNGSSIEARRTKSFLADIIGFRSSHIRSPVCVNALRENDRGFIIKNVSTIVIPVCWSPVGEYQRERAGYKINVNTGSEACLYMLYGISCCTRVAFRIRAGGKAS